MSKTPREVLEKYEYDIQHFDCRKKYYKVKYDGEIDNLWTKLLKDLEALIPKKKKRKREYLCSEDYGNGVRCPEGITHCSKCKYGEEFGLSYRLGDKYYNQAIGELHKLYKQKGEK